MIGAWSRVGRARAMHFYPCKDPDAFAVETRDSVCGASPGVNGFHNSDDRHHESPESFYAGNGRTAGRCRTCTKALKE